MNSLVVGIIAIVFILLGYKFYGKIIEKVWGTDPAKPTPAVEIQDGVDYVPAKHWTVLFGHHFASIAGAGPILGPVIAAVVWGWLPALIWIVLGCIFLGGVHDFSALIISLRHNGKSIADISEKVLNFKSKMVFAAFILLSLILVIVIRSFTRNR